MRPRAFALLSLSLSLSLIAVQSAVANSNEPDGDKIADAYASPGQLVELRDGRAMNLRCSGQGEPVIMLEAGGNADSSTWYRVQPRLARLTRVCSYDRAGYGFSDQGPLPRDLAADVADLDALVRAAGIATPILLVGHSLGSNVVRKYAQLHPQGVAGLVLVDPPEQGADDQMPQEWQAQVAAQLTQRNAFLDDCETAAVAGDTETLQGKCLRAPPPWMGAAVASAMAQNKAKPSYWRTLRSELASNIDVFSAPVPVDESHGSIPLVLLRAPSPDDDVPDEVRDATEAARSQTHARLVAASTRGVLVEVPDSSHDIQLDQPEAVVSAVRNLLESKTEN